MYLQADKFAKTDSFDFEMFSKLYRTFSSSRFLRSRIQSVLPFKHEGRCTRCIKSVSNKNLHGTTASAQQSKFLNSASKRSFKCSVGVLFLQRQFMRNLCLVQTNNKDSPQQNSTDSASLKPEQTLGGLSAVLSAFGGFTPNVDVNQNVPYQRNHNKFEDLCNSKHYPSNAMTTDSVLSLQQLPGDSGFTRTANNSINVITADGQASSCYRHYSVPVRCYSTSPKPKPSEGARDETQETPEKIPLEKQNIYTIPNFLTMSRICMTPLLGYLVVQEAFPLACGLFFVAGLTDLADGYIARRYPSQISAFGSFFDPLADKILISVLFVSLTFVKLIPLSLAVLVIGRDIGLIVAAFYVRYISLTQPITFKQFFDATHPSAQLQPMMISKVNTGLQLGLVTVSLAAPVFGFVDHICLHYLWWLTAFTTSVSAIGYAVYGKDTFKILQKRRKIPK